MDTKKLRQKILDLAIRGKLVPQDPNDEPASVLLERIKAEKERLIQEGKIKRPKKSTADTSHYQNWPFEMPNGWEWIRLEDLLTLLSGQDFPPEKYNERGDGIPYVIGASNIENEELIINRWTDSPSVISIPNDILIVCKGSGVGKIAKNNIGKVHIARQIQAIRDETETIESEYIKICIYNNISDIISKANGLIPGLKRELLLSLSLPIPPLQEQKRIVSVVKEYLSLMESIETNNFDLQSAIGKAKKIVLNLAIQGELVPQDPDEEPAIELLKRINPNIKIPCDNPHYPYKIPNSWCWAKGNMLFAPMQSCSPKGNVFKYIDIDTIDNKNNSIKSVKVVPTKEAPSRASRFTKRDDTLFSMVRPYLRNIAIVNEDDCIASTGFYVCRTNGCLDDKYCFYMMLSSYVVDGLNAFMKGDNSPSINKGHVESFVYPLPPMNEQKRIVIEVEKYFRVLDKIKESLTA